jgi:NADPH:quinone reductase-like Zn-dependent oxidoreductase
MFKTDDMIEQHHLLEKISALIDSKKIKTSLTKVLAPINAENLRKAHALIESGSTIGKVVLENW